MQFTLPWKRDKLSEVWNWPHVFYLNFLGLWIIETTVYKYKVFMKILRIVNLVGATLLCLTLLLSILMKFAHQHITKTLFALTSAGVLCIGDYNLFQIVRHRKTLKRAMDLLDELLYETRDEEYINILRKKLTRVWSFFIFCIMAVFFGAFHWYFRPLLFILIRGEKTPVVDGWPLFMNTWLQFSLTYTFQVISSFPIVTGICTFDSIYFSISELVLCHLAILGNELEKCNMRRNEAFQLKELVKIHIKILEVCSNLRKASEAVLVVRTLFCITSYCCGLFIMIMGNDMNLTIVMNLSEGLIVLTIFLYLLCWYSDEICIQSNKLGTSAYMSNWLEGNEIEKKILLNLMTRTKAPLIFGGFMNIKLNTFLNTLKMTFSYYNFLLSVTD